MSLIIASQIPVYFVAATNVTYYYYYYLTAYFSEEEKYSIGLWRPLGGGATSKALSVKAAVQERYVS